MQDVTISIIAKLRKFLVTKEVSEVRCGLCFNLGLDHLPHSVQREMFNTWEHNSGVWAYPVPSSDPYLNSSHYYNRCAPNDLYTGEQLEYRLSLAEHIINYLNTYY